MKNLKLLPAMLAALLVKSAAIFNACSKQENSEPYSTAEQPQMSSADQMILNRIESFKQKVSYIHEHPNFKSGESMIVDSAIWYIGATLNYTYSNAGYPFAKLHRDTAYFEMELLNSYEATIEKVVESYDASLSKLSQSYYRIADEDKKFITASVNATGNNANGNVELQIVTITGTGTLTNHQFGADEAYKFDMDATEDCFYGNDAQGAPKIFEVYLSKHFNPEPTGNWHWWFYGEETVFTLYYKDFVLNDIKVNYLDYKIFAASESDAPITSETECLEFDQNGSGIHEMQFYYDYLVETIEEELGEYSSYLYYTPKSEIKSKDETVRGYREIWHTPEIHLQRRGKAYFLANDPPIMD